MRIGIVLNLGSMVLVGKRGFLGELWEVRIQYLVICGC